jgi:hypothetical protein
VLVLLVAPVRSCITAQPLFLHTWVYSYFEAEKLASVCQSLTAVEIEHILHPNL